MRTRLIIRCVAAFDLIATLPLAIPCVADAYLQLLLSGFGLLRDDSGWLPMAASTALFCNLAGILAVLWNLARWQRPEENGLVRMDITGRIAVGGLLTYYLLALGVPKVLWIFVASELLGALLQALTLRHRAGLQSKA